MPQLVRYLPRPCDTAVLWFLVASATFSLADPAGAAQTKPDTDSESLFEETVVVASRVPTSLSNQGVSVSVIDRDELELRSYSDIADFLDLLPGVSTTRDGGLGKAAALRIRGEEGFRTRIILDGIDIADPSSPQISPRIEHLMAEGLERIEVLRGPQGLMYGADAGGVISLSSLQPREGLTANLLAEIGERDHQRLGAHIAGGGEHIA
ncbi:MAG: TonB-dependent receptor plug domain-containing protein, partial [Cellvibrionales bacterium]